MYFTPPVIIPNEDAEVSTDLGPYHVAMFRDCRTGAYEKTLTFGLRCVNCDQDVRYNHDSKDPPASTWTCGGCTAPGNLVFTDLDLERASLVRMQQKLYVIRRFSTKEEIFKLDTNNERGGGYMFSRPITLEERADYHERIINDSVATYIKERKST